MLPKQYIERQICRSNVDLQFRSLHPTKGVHVNHDLRFRLQLKRMNLFPDPLFQPFPANELVPLLEPRLALIAIAQILQFLCRENRLTQSKAIPLGAFGASRIDENSPHEIC